MNPILLSVLRHSPFTNKLNFTVNSHLSSVITTKDLRLTTYDSQNIYLTFDDGPNPGTTEFIIEQLNKFNAKATFFCIGNNIDKHPQTFNLYSQNGHAIGNHTYHHLNGWKTDNQTYYNDIINCQSAISHQPSAISKPIFRPPYGRLRISQIRHLQKLYKIYLWSVISYDFDRNTTEDKCLKNVLNKTKDGSIVVFHDSNKAGKNMFYTLPRVLEHYSEKGYSFKSL